MQLLTVLTLSVCAALTAPAEHAPRNVSMSSGAIAWRSGATVVRAMAHNQVTERIAAHSAQTGASHLIVQFDRPLTSAQRKRLADGGLRLLDGLGDHAFFASASNFDAGALGDIPFRAAIDVEPRWKIHPLLTAAEPPSWSQLPPRSSNGATPRAGDTRVVVNVLFFRDVAFTQTGSQIIRNHGGSIRSSFRALNGGLVELPFGSVLPLAAEDAVQWIEPPLPALGNLNDSNRWETQADQVQAAPYGLDGSGVRVLLFDGGVADTTHPDLAGHVTAHDDIPADHPTHVCGTIAGNGAASGGKYRGMAPAAQVESYSFESDDPFSFGWLYTDPGDIAYDYAEAMQLYGVDIANNSIGTNVCRNGFPCEVTGDYGVTAALLDSIVTGGLGRSMSIVWANGNERGHTGECDTGHCCRCIAEGVHTPDGYHSTAPPACAKNPIGVGAINSNDDSVTWFTSWGPCDDGRLKPDVVAPGCQSDDDFGVTSTVPEGGYDAYCGTSMAAPTVTGLAALVLEDYHNQFPGAARPFNSTLKAIFAQTAVDIGTPGPDYATGYGAVRVRDAIDLVRDGGFAEGKVAQGRTESFMIEVPPGTSELKVTLAWDDPPAAPNVVPSLVNDLDLVVHDPQGARYMPWTLDPAAPAAPAVQTREDHTNNVEQVNASNPASGLWRVNVIGQAVSGQTQTFSICARPRLRRDCDTNGVPDDTQIQADPSLDCTNNGWLDVCEPDCDLNGVADSCDIAAGSSVDCDLNGIPDQCDLASGAAPDCNANGVPDSCDVFDGYSADCNRNVIPDECEADCNGTGLPDDCDIAAGSSDDCNANTVPDECDLAAGSSDDTNANGTPDECEGPVVFVNASATGLNNGTSWRHAYTDLVHALAVAANSPQIVEIWVAAGTYHPTSGTDRAASFQLVEGAKVLGGFAGTETDAAQRDWTSHPTILSGDIGAAGNDADNSYHVVVGGDVTSTGILDGFTITGGHADGSSQDEFDVGGGLYLVADSPSFANCRIEHNWARGVFPGGGGGVFAANGAHPSFTNCAFFDNSSSFGGAMYNTGASIPELLSCLFEENVAEINAGAILNTEGSDAVIQDCRFIRNSAYSGGAITNGASHPSISGCEFTENHATGNDMAGALLNVASSPTVTDCRFIRNDAGNLGGAVSNWQQCNPAFYHCEFRDNRLRLPSAEGGAVHNRGSTATYVDCLFVNNESTFAGGAMSNVDCDTTIINSTFHHNIAELAGAIEVGRSRVTLRNSIAWNNAATNGAFARIWDSSTLAIGNSDIEGLADDILVLSGQVDWLGGSFDADPLFVANIFIDHFLSQAQAGQATTSPCVDAGDAPAADLALDRRTTRTDGRGDAGTVDLGYHHALPDCNSNGIPDFADVDAGTSADCAPAGNGIPDECEPDCDTDGVVDSCEIALGSSTDCDDNWIPDDCETYRDCNSTGIHDPCDIMHGASADCDGNYVPDECQSDCDADGLPDVCELAPLGPSGDCNSNAIPDECDIASGLSNDCDADGVPDECQPDCNLNMIADPCDIASGASGDCNSNAIPDECDLAAGTSVDADGSGLPDECEADCNHNGVADLFDIFSGTSNDCDANGVPDECDPDCNTNGSPDACDLATWNSQDCNGNQVPDECDVAAGAADCNGNLVPDQCEMAGGYLLRTITNPQPSFDRSFGQAVAASGNEVFVGSPSDETAAPDAGAVYAFDRDSGALLHTFVKPDAAEDDGFGSAIAVLDGMIAIGTPFDDTAAEDAGAVYVFDIATGALLHTLMSPTPDAGDRFGAGIAAAGDKIIISAYVDDTQLTNAGAAYVFDATSGTVIRTLLSPAPKQSGFFGSSLACAGSLVLVGAPREDGGGTSAGAAYLYDMDTGAMLRTFGNPSPNAYDSFGSDVAIVGDLYAVSAYLDDTVADNAGAVYVFAGDGSLVHTLFSPDPQAGEQFGSPAAELNGRLLVSSTLHNFAIPGVGAVYLFDLDEGVLDRTFKNPTPATGDSFGAALAPANGDILIGAWRDDTIATDAGAAYLFDTGADCDGNFVPDACDIAAGTSRDRNDNGVPDRCELCGDIDGNFVVDAVDYEAFLAAFGHGDGQQGYNPAADFDGDGFVTSVDYQLWLLCYREFGDLSPTPGDYDADCDVDLADYAALTGCLTGPRPTGLLMSRLTGRCADAFDLDRDSDIDLADFAALQRDFAISPNGATLPCLLYGDDPPSALSTLPAQRTGVSGSTAP